jgi:hypothetical protein
MPVVTFKTQLAECRKIAAEEPDDGWRDFTLQVIDRWRDEPDVDKAWQTIMRAATSGGRKPLSPLPLIEWVIEQAIVHRRLCDDVIAESERLENRVIAAAEKDWLAGRQPGNTDMSWAAAAKREIAQQHRADRMRVLGRQPKLAPQKRFIKLCREMFVSTCGQPLERVVEMLASVVVGHELKPNAVRDALKSTTRKGRDTRGKK